MLEYSKPIAESNNFIVLDKYTKEWVVNESYQSEDSLERELIADLKNQGYDYLPKLNTPDKMLDNARVKLQTLNNMTFSDVEWRHFVEEYLDKPSNNSIDKTRKIHDDYIYDFVFDDGHIPNIYLMDKANITRNTQNTRKKFCVFCVFRG